MGVTMKLHILLIVGLVLGVSGCENEQQAAPEPVEETQPAETKSYRYDGFLKHMHAHADQVDLINNALADDDLDATIAPARWLYRHDAVEGVAADWQPYLIEMREAARAVESAADLETARAASKRITEQCQACHAAAGIIGKGD